MPADAVETAEMRAASLRSILGGDLAATHETAAWVHGALATAPLRHRVQRCTSRRTSPVLDPRVHYRDMPLPETDIMRIGRVAVTTPVRTLTDLVRESVAEGPDAVLGTAVDGLLAADPTLSGRGVDALARGPAVHHRRAAMERLDALGAALRTR